MARKTFATMEASNKTEHEETRFFRNKSSWWKHRRTIQYGLSAIVHLIFISCLVFVFIIGMMPANYMQRYAVSWRQSLVYEDNLNEQTANNDTCLEPECIHASSAILMTMDPEVKPCDNFHKFACGRFLNFTIIPDEKDSVDTFDIIGEELDKQLRRSIEENRETNEFKPFRLVNNLYKSCMNKELIESRGLKPLKKGLKKLGGWPVIDGDLWNSTSFEWKKAIYKFRQVGYSPSYLINFNVMKDPKNNTRHVIIMDQPQLCIPREYLTKGLDNKFVDNYYSYMVDVAVIMGAPKYRATIELRDSLLFEIELANITVPKENRRNPTLLYNPMNLTILSEKYPSMPWKQYLNKLLSSKISIDDDDIAVIAVPRYIEDFLKLIDSTPKRIQANYLMWRATRASIVHTNEQIRKRQLMYFKAFTGKTERMPRWKECVEIVSNRLATSVGAMYVKKYFNEEAKENVNDMFVNIRQQFEKTLRQVKWLEEKTRRSALEKSAAMSRGIGYYDEILDNEKLEKFYEELQLSEDNYFENILNLNLFDKNYAYGRLRKPANKNDWIKHGGAAVVNAFHSPNENSIQLPAGILQGAFFGNKRPRYMNYGGIGFIIGHEITHGFDDRGRQYDKNGNLLDWWQSSTKEKYLERVKCIIEQYGNYTVDDIGLNVNGINTQGENIGDNGGMKISYGAYENWLEKNSPEKVLPGLSYTPRQMFWISAANVWCSKSRKEDLKLRIVTDSHSPAEFRILGTLSNIPEFSRDFNCPIGSRMNPEKKCSVW